MGVDALLDWYEAVRRPLPWRFTRDPWAILVAEVMLQQTQAARVVPHYERFLALPGRRARWRPRPPPRRSRAWSGLGYNRRVLALRAAAGVVAERGWPEPERLEELPGVGPYTAAAVGSFAWDAPMAAVDTNVRRVIERRDGVRRSPRALARRAAELVPEGRAAAWNQAMMELGATVCRPRRPRCGECPLRAGLRRARTRSRRRRDRAGSASRTAIAGRAGACSPRLWPVSSRPARAGAARARARRARPRRARRPRAGGGRGAVRRG